MNSDLIIILPAVVLMLMIIGITASSIVENVLSHKREMRDLDSKMDASADPLLAERTQMIEDRLAVLERLATDKGTLLSDEIEALRLDVSERREKEASQ